MITHDQRPKELRRLGPQFSSSIASEVSQVKPLSFPQGRSDAIYNESLLKGPTPLSVSEELPEPANWQTPTLAQSNIVVNRGEIVKLTNAALRELDEPVPDLEKIYHEKEIHILRTTGKLLG